jgi:hypothetical protein
MLRTRSGHASFLLVERTGQGQLPVERRGEAEGPRTPANKGSAGGRGEAPFPPAEIERNGHNGNNGHRELPAGPSDDLLVPRRRKERDDAAAAGNSPSRLVAGSSCHGRGEGQVGRREPPDCSLDSHGSHRRPVALQREREEEEAAQPSDGRRCCACSAGPWETASLTGPHGVPGAGGRGLLRPPGGDGAEWKRKQGAR